MELPRKPNAELAQKINGKEMFCKRLKKDMVFTDEWSDDMDERELDESELLAGELSATNFTVGCYTVRTAFRVFKIPEYNEALTENDYRIPADKEDLEYAKKLDYVESMPKKIKNAMRMMKPYRIFGLDKKRLHIVHEIKAKYNTDSDDIFKNKFKYICDVDYQDRILMIYTAREKSLSDEYASLFIIKKVDHAWGGWNVMYQLDTNGVLFKFDNDKSW